ncbi:hypothetical protein FBR05_00210 [Deltaproteobacteria bacterium PRO3]|nr:hypothetical protein [Deltaproteobacteria bacterium PRO3]
MGKSKPKPSQPYQGPQFGAQQQLLSDTVLGNMLGQNAYNRSGASGPVWNVGTSYASGQSGGSYYPGGTNYNPIMKTLGTGGTGLNQGYMLQGGGGGFGSGNKDLDKINQYRALNYAQLGQIQPNAPQGFQYAGAPIAGQMGSNTTVGRLPATTTGSGMRYRPFQFWDPGANFTERTPFQFTETPRVNVQDIYAPQMDIARRDLTDQAQKSEEQILADMNRRGMLTSGAANRAVMLNLQERDRRLADLSSQYSIEHGRMQLQEDQMRRQMEAQRQLSQAEELFRQMGATDEQAKFLASQNVNLQGQQAGQNLAGFQANLGAQQQQYGQGLSNAQLLMGQQGQQFQQALQGRQQATAEEQLANLFRRQPLEDLMKMWQQQSGQIGATEGSAGAMGVLGPLIGMGLSFI